ncbi:cytochrome P450 [Frankia torreyi]|uniref:Cytochrome P450 n=3 Tax=Frankia TaxID=1854 RepID=A0A0D8B7M3_9ACTN|nr:cytochrome P450 [Frankia torreyi]
MSDSSGASGAPMPFPFPDGPMATAPPEFARRRSECPLSEVVLPTGDPALVAVRHADIQQIMSDDKNFTRDLSSPDAPRLFHNMLLLEDPTILLNMHGEDHLRLRRIVASAFTPRRAEQARPEISKIIDRLLDDVESGGHPADLMTFARLLPTRFISQILGVPEDDGEQLLEWVSAWLSFALPREDLDRAANDFSDYARALVERKRAEPGDSLIDHIINAHDVEDRLSENELISMIRMLIIGGNETIANAISRSLFSLLSQRQHWAALLADRSLVPAAIEELLRHNPPGGGTTGLIRLATADVELTSGSGVIRAGQGVFTPLVAAGHDPAVFPDPEQIRFDRPKTHSTMQFGAGRHYCLGVHLARVELELTLNALLDRFPNLRLAVPPAELPWSEGSYGVGLTGLPVVW